MKALRLSFQAFGPFAQLQVVDFSKLADALYLINGPTGAGKSALLDAVCFALYGNTTGNEREAADMRCQYASPHTLTQVTFEFALGERRFLIERWPKQSKPKSRGQGVTEQAAGANLYQMDAQGQPQLMASRKVQQVNQAVVALLGLTSAQFRQVMVLPQGLFRQLLLASSKEREPILSQLFQTHVYGQLEKNIKEQAKAVLEQKKRLDERVQAVLDGAGVSDVDALEQALDSAGQQADQWHQAQTQCTQAKQAADRAQQKGFDWQRQFEQCQQLQHQLNQLDQQQPAINLIEHQWTLAQKAQQLQPTFDQWQTTQQHDQKARQALADHQAWYHQAQQAWQRLQPALEALQAQKAQAQTLIQTLATLEKQRPQLDQLVAYDQAWQACQDKQAALQQTWAQQSQALVAQQQAHEEQRQRLDALQAALADGTELVKQQSQLAQLLEAQQALHASREALAQSTQSLHQAQTTLAQKAKADQAAQKALQHQQMDWHLGQAAELAAQLTPDHPCPVCGSEVHPSPAQWPQTISPVTQADLEAAQTHQTQMHQAWQAQHTEVTRLETRQQHWIQQCEKQRQQCQQQRQPLAQVEALTDEDIERTQQCQAQVEQQWSRYQAQKAEIEQLQQQWAQQTDTLEKLREAETSAKKAYQAAETQTQLAAQAYQQTWQNLATDYPTHQALTEAIEAHQTQLDQLQSEIAHTEALKEDTHNALVKATQAHKQAQTAQQQWAQETQTHHQAWQQALAQSAFADQAAFEDAQASQAKQTQWRDQIDAFYDQRKDLTARMAQLQETLAQQPRPDMQALSQSVAQAETALEQATQAYQQAYAHCSELKKAQRALAEMAQSHEGLAQAYQQVGTLSEVLNGQNEGRMSLQRYVLSVLLDDVLVNATERLKRMSKGRYGLLRQQAASKNNRSSGLELDVYDHYTGQSRPVATLSGGESFMAALALALGLSDIVQSFAGGIRLDTLFIDEGFGSLDSEALALAIETLQDLQISGRSIGIISHVQTLKAQIPQRIDVTSCGQGSQLSLVGV